MCGPWLFSQVLLIGGGEGLGLGLLGLLLGYLTGYLILKTMGSSWKRAHVADLAKGQWALAQREVGRVCHEVVVHEKESDFGFVHNSASLRPLSLPKQMKQNRHL